MGIGPVTPGNPTTVTADVPPTYTDTIQAPSPAMPVVAADVTALDLVHLNNAAFLSLYSAKARTDSGSSIGDWGAWGNCLPTSWTDMYSLYTFDPGPSYHMDLDVLLNFTAFVRPNDGPTSFPSAVFRLVLRLASGAIIHDGNPSNQGDDRVTLVCNFDGAAFIETYQSLSIHSLLRLPTGVSELVLQCFGFPGTSGTVPTVEGRGPFRSSIRYLWVP